MLLKKNLLCLLNAVIFCNCFFIKCVSCIRQKNAGNSKINNPWEGHMNKFQIHKVHGLGVYNDIYGTAKDSSKGVIYKFPIGKCPVFGKVLEITNSDDFLNYVPVNKLSTETFLSDMASGDVTGFPIGSKNAGFQFPKINDGIYKEWESPVSKNNILDCAEYVNRFEHFIEPSTESNNCFSQKYQGVCLKQPFFYNTETKMCYILYPVLQNREGKKDKKLDYNPLKMSHRPNFVFGSTNIRKDWMEACPVKPVKGVMFGLWKNNKCEKVIENIQYTLKDYPFLECGRHLFFLSGLNVHWAHHIGSNNTCEYSLHLPNCLIYEKTSFALTSLGTVTSNVYDLPPCFHESQGWKINANCIDGKDREYTCQNNIWITSDGKKITKCEQPIVSQQELSTSNVRLTGGSSIFVFIFFVISIIS